MPKNVSGEAPEKLPMVAGNNSNDDANIGGITPELLSFKGKCVDCDVAGRSAATWRFGCASVRRPD